MVDKKKIFIYGVPSGGLFGLRQLRQQWPNSIIYVLAPKTDIGYYSNAYNRFYEVTTREQVREVTYKAYKDIGEGDVDAFIYSNRLLEYMIDGNQELFDLLHFENPYDTYRTIVDKTEADKLCRELGLPRPIEYDLSDLNHYASISYPIVVKPLEKQKAKKAAKCKFITCEQELKSYINLMTSHGFNVNNFTCQQAIMGSNQYEYGYGGFFSDGIPVIDICFHQFRQSPQGLCCYIREMTDEGLIKEIKDMVAPFVKKVKYNGFIEFDIKQDMATKILYVLDINPRPWGSSDMLRTKLASSTVYNPSLTNCRVVWRKMPLDSFVSNKTNNNLPHSRCKKITGTAGFKSSYALYDRKDPKPFFITIKKFLFSFLVRFKHIIHA